MQSKEKTNILNMFDFSPIDALDPSLLGGHALLFDRELPASVIIREHQGQQQQLSERLRIKLLWQEEGDGQIRLQVTSDADLYFLFMFKCSFTSYKAIRQKQKLYVSFKEYPEVVRKVLERLERNSQNLTLSFLILSDQAGFMSVLQKSQFKDYELLAFPMQKAQDHYIRQMITFRYVSMRSKWALMQTRLEQINQLVKVKNPSLLLQLRKIEKS